MNEDKVIKTVVVYGRVSTATQEEQQTIQTQLSAVREHATKNSYTIVREYLDEGWSGDMLERPNLDQMRIDAKKRLWDAVLIYDPDRLARRYSFQELIMDELRDLGIETLFVTVSAPKSDDERMLYGVRGLFAQYERTKIRERFRLGKVRKAKDGHIVASEAPYGYMLVKRQGERGDSNFSETHYDFYEPEARVVRLIFSWIANEQMTIRKAVGRLQDLKILPRKSNRGVWNTSTLNTLLRNKTYIGEGHYGASYAVVPQNPLKKEGYRKIKKTSRKMKPESEWIKIPTPAIFEGDTGKKLFEKAQQQLSVNLQLSQRNKKNHYLVSGKIRCTCGRSRAGEGPQKGKYLYYRCSSRVHSYPLPSPCDERGVNANVVDELVWAKVYGLMTSKDQMLKHARRWMNRRRDRVQNIAVDTTGFKKEITKLKKQEDRLTIAYSDGSFTLGKLQEYIDPIKKKVASLEAQIARANALVPTDGVLIPDDSAIQTYASKAAMLRDLKFDEKRAIVLRTVDRIEASQKQLHVYGRIPVTNHVEFKTSYRNSWVTKRGKIHAF